MKELYEGKSLYWVSPGSVHFSREHIEFLLPFLYNMREGYYPAEPSGGYVNGGLKGAILSHAHFETAAQIAAEVDRRLSHTGLDRYLVEDFYCGEVTDVELARQNHMELWDVQRRIGSAVGYISSGDCPRYADCKKCLKYKGCRKRKRKQRGPVSYRDWCRYRNRENGRSS